jgi:hypothetical protein
MSRLGRSAWVAAVAAPCSDHARELAYYHRPDLAPKSQAEHGSSGLRRECPVLAPRGARAPPCAGAARRAAPRRPTRLPACAASRMADGCSSQPNPNP